MNHWQANQALMAVLLVTLLSVSGIALPYPIFAPLFSSDSAHLIAQFADIDKSLLFAAVLAAYPLGMFIGSAFIGPLSDAQGRKKTLLMTSSFSALSYLVSAYAIAQDDFLLLLLSRFLTGICEGNIAIGRAILTDLSQYIDKTKAFSYLYAVSYAGWLLGPLVGGYSSSYGYEYAFYIAAIVTAGSLIAIALFIPETNTPSEKSDNPFKASLQQNSFKLLREKSIKRFFTMYIFLTSGLMIFYQYFPMWLTTSFSYTSQTLAHATVMQTIAMVLVSTMLVSRVKKRIGIAPTIYVGIISLATLLISIPTIQAGDIYWYFFCTGATIALYNGLVPVYASDVYEHIPQGKLMGLLTSTYCLSGVLAALIAGLISTLSVLHSIQFAGLLLLLALIQLVLIHRKSAIKTEKAVA